MNGTAVAGLTAAGALAGIPTAALAYATPARGNLRLPRRWWCGAPAPPRATVAIALLTGAATAVIAACLPWSLAVPAYWLFATLGVGLAIIDIRCRRLPHAMTGTLWGACALGLAADGIASGHLRPLGTATAAGTGVAVLALLIAFALPGQLGLGDVSLAGAITFSLAGQSLTTTAAVGLSVGVVIQACLAVGHTLRRRDHPGPSHLPFGPALLIGWFIALIASTG